MNQNILTQHLSYVFLFIGLILVAVSIFYKSEKAKLKQTGLVADGIVYEQESNATFNLSSDTTFNRINDKITIRFVTQKEEWITGMIQQDVQMFYTGQYKNGDVVKVYYDPNNPSNFYVDTKQSESTTRAVVTIGGLIFIIVGLYKMYF